MKKIFSLLIIVAVLLGVFFSSLTSGIAKAQEISTPTVEVPPIPGEPLGDLESGVIPFIALGQSDIVMRGPYASTDVRYTPPASWQLDSGASLTLIVNSSFSAATNVQGEENFGATLDVSVNGELVETLFISQPGLQTFVVSIPSTALVSNRLDGRHIIRFFLDAAYDCGSDKQTTIIIQSNSTVELPHTLVSPAADLSRLPHPFYQQSSFLSENTTMVVPVSPTALELQAAMTVSAAFGRMSLGEMTLSVIPENQLTDIETGSNHLIFVGDTARMPLLQSVKFSPDTGAQADDGILQMAVSPWNPARAVLHVSGTSEVGLQKAAQTLTYGVVQPGADASLSVISDVKPDVADREVATDRSFADLGYPTQTVKDYGVSKLEYRLYVPSGFVAGLDPYVNLSYSHSALVDLSTSGLLVTLNDQRLSSVRFTEESAKQVSTLKIAIPEDALRAGDNRLILEVELLPSDICSDFSLNGLWFTVNSSSLVHLPLIPAQMSNTAFFADLSMYPYPFISHPTLADLGIVLSADDPVSWKIASQLSAGLGRRATGQLLVPQIAYADSVSDEFKQNNLIFIGRPSFIPLISEMASSMPAPFEPGADLATERTLPVVYRLPEGSSLGYIELFASPWNDSRNILTVLGSTSEGLDWAYRAMTDSNLKGRLAGNYVVVNREQVLATDTRLDFPSGVSATVVPDAESAIVASPVPYVGTLNQPASPKWILPAILLVSLLTVGIVGFVIVKSVRQMKR